MHPHSSSHGSGNPSPMLLESGRPCLLNQIRRLDEPKSRGQVYQFRPMSQNHMVGACRFGGDMHEAEGAIETVRARIVRPQPEASKASVRRPHHRTDKLRADPLSPVIGVDVKGSDPPHHRIFQVGVTVQPADADDMFVVGGDEDRLTGLIETVPARLPSQSAGGREHGSRSLPPASQVG